MAFGTGLSGVNAANQDLKVTGNNIANASTTGFKLSRAEFGDAYTQSILGMGRTPIGGGVNVAEIGQKFTQGNISQTGNALDMAIDGTGFFITDYPGIKTTYTRSGIFGINDQGYVVSNQGARLQGFGITDRGTADGVLGDIRIDQETQPPQATQRVDAGVNVPAGAPVLQQLGSITRTNGLAIGQVQTGAPEATATTLSTIGPPRTEGTAAELRGDNPVDTDFSIYPPATTQTVDIQFRGPNIGDGSVITETIEPFPSGTTVDNLGQLIQSFQRAIENNQNLAGRVRVEENPNQAGHLRLIADGPFASDGTEILGISNNVGTLVDDMGLDSVTTILPIAGSVLFADGGSIDLTSIEGRPVQVIGNDNTQLVFNNLQTGSPTTLEGGLDLTDPANQPIGNGDGDLSLNIQSGSVLETITVTPPFGGYPDESGLLTAIQAEIAGSALDGILTADIGPNGGLRFTNVANSSNPISVSDGGSTDSGVNADSLGLTSNNIPAPILIEGEADTPANNEFVIEVQDDAGTYTATIVIPANDYDDTQAVVDAINSQINSSPALFGRVSAEAINNRVGFSLSELGGLPNALSVDGDPIALEALGHTSQNEPPPINPVDRETSFRVNLNVPLPDPDERSGSIEVRLNENIRSIEQLAQAINRELADVPEEDFIEVIARVVTNPDGTKQLEFVASKEGEPSEITISDIRAPGEDITQTEIEALLQIDRFNSDLLDVGEPQVTNGYPEQTFILEDPDGESRAVTLEAERSAARIASRLSDEAGVRASATTDLTFRADNYVNGGDMNLLINGQLIEANSFQGMVEEINGYQQTTLRGITASLDDDGDLQLRSASGADIQVQIESPRTADRLTLIGQSNTSPITLGGSADAETTARVGGVVEIILNEGVTMRQPDPRVTGLFNGLTRNDFEDFVINDFNPQDSDTYNERASITIYDSLGTPHQLDLFFVKDRNDPDRPQDLNSWTVYAQVDGEDVGDPDEDLPFPENQEPTRASFKMFFNPDGTMDREASDDWLISNWIPRNDEGEPTGAYAPENVAEGGRLPLEQPNTTSNFEISFRNTTQYGGDFARNDFQQDGYASGRLRDLNVDDKGNIFARYTNGENQLLGQVAVANFRNPEGLQPSGFTEWMETQDSGSVTVSTAGTGVLGDIRSASLEDSNVDLSEQLVNLIIAQRNYQASAKTIETTNAVTQTIINLR